MGQQQFALLLLISSIFTFIVLLLYILSGQYKRAEHFPPTIPPPTVEVLPCANFIVDISPTGEVKVSEGLSLTDPTEDLHIPDRETIEVWISYTVNFWLTTQIYWSPDPIEREKLLAGLSGASIDFYETWALQMPTGGEEDKTAWVSAWATFFEDMPQAHIPLLTYPYVEHTRDYLFYLFAHEISHLIIAYLPISPLIIKEEDNIATKHHKLFHSIGLNSLTIPNNTRIGDK